MKKCIGIVSLLLIPLVVLLSFTAIVIADGVNYSAINLSKTETTMTLGSTQTVQVYGIPTTGDPVNITGDSLLTYSSSNTLIATVNQTGLVTARITGMAIITVTRNNPDGTHIASSIVIVPTYSGIYSKSSFETTDANLPAAGLSTAQARTGSYSLYASALTADYQFAPYPNTAVNAMVEAWFYDSLVSGADGYYQGRSQNSEYYLFAGIRNATSSACYTFGSNFNSAGWNYTATSVQRQIGWHQIIFDITIIGTQKVYIDGVLVGTGSATQASIYFSCRFAKCATANSGIYYDDFRVHNMGGPPAAYNVNITGSKTIGSTLTGAYSFYAARGEAESGSTYRWLRAGTAISGATSRTYTTSAADSGKTLVFEVTPKSTYAIKGAAVQSSSVLIEPIQVNNIAFLKQNGSQWDDITSTGLVSGNIKASFAIDSYDATNPYITMVAMGLYSGNKLVSVNVLPVAQSSVPANDTIVCEPILNVSLPPSGFEAYKLKLFVWNNSNVIRPIKNQVVFGTSGIQ